MDHCQELMKARRYEEAAAVCLAAGDVELKRGDRRRAREDYERALSLAPSAGDRRQTAAAAYGLFYLAWEEMDYRRALRLAIASYQAAEEARDSVVQLRAALALYTVLVELGDLAGAGRALEQALELGSGQEAAVLANLLLNQGTLRLEEGRMALSRDACSRALALAGKGGSARFHLFAHLNLVEASLALGDLTAAERHLAAAGRYAEAGAARVMLLYHRSCVEHARGRQEGALAAIRAALAQDPPPGWAWKLLLQQGVVEEAQGDRRQAEEAYRRAAGVVEAERAALGFDELKATLLDARRRPLEALFRLQAEAGRRRQALATVERATARSFLDAFIHATSTRTDEPAGAWPAMTAADRTDALHTLLPALSRSSAVAPRPIGEVLAALGDRQALVFFEAEGRFWRITAGKSRLDVAPLAASAQEIERLVDEHLAQPDAQRPAEALGQILLPAGSLPAAGEPVYVVPDGVLGQVPFAALRTGGRYLVEDHPVAYLPSLSALAATARQPAGPAGPAVVLGDPRGDLPEAAREAREVALRLRAVPLTGEGAAQEALERAAGAAVLHLATHTGIGPRGPWLALADGEVGSELLLARRIRPRLVTLASCASAARRGRGGWGSLAATFLAAGSRSVLASLWSVDDAAARRLILRFYAEDGVRHPALALARAQRAAIAAGEPPSAWAPFLLVTTQ